MTALLLTVLRFDATVLLPHFLSGFALAAVYNDTGSFWPSVLLHASRSRVLASWLTLGVCSLEATGKGGLQRDTAAGQKIRIPLGNRATALG